MSFEEQLQESPEVASLRSQARGDRGLTSVSFAADTGPHEVTVTHKLGVVPSIINLQVNAAPPAGTVLGATIATSTAQDFTVHVTSNVAITAGVNIRWKAEA